MPFQTATKLSTIIALSTVYLAISYLISACQKPGSDSIIQNHSISSTFTPNPTSNTKGLKIGSLLPMTGDLSAGGQPIVDAVPLLVETVNKCGGVNSKPVTLIAEDDQTQPAIGAAAMTKLAEFNRVAGVVGSLSSSISMAAIDVAVRNQVMLISPASTSPVFTERAKKGDFQGFWARTAPSDIYQAQALAKLAREKGFKRVATIVINNDYGVNFEKAFMRTFKQLGGTIVNEAKPTRYDIKGNTFETEAAAAFAGKPDAIIAVLYPETGSLLLKSAYQQGLSKGVQIMLTDGVYAADFPGQVGKSNDGKFILAGAIGVAPGADGKALQSLTQLWQTRKNRQLSAAVPHTWDAAALLVLAAQAAKSNTGEGIKSKIREVASSPGIEVTDVCQGLKLLREGKDINYQGASGNVDIDEYGDVTGSYDIWTVKADGKLTVLGKVSPK